MPRSRSKNIESLDTQFVLSASHVYRMLHDPGVVEQPVSESVPIPSQCLSLATVLRCFPLSFDQQIRPRAEPSVSFTRDSISLMKNVVQTVELLRRGAPSSWVS